MLLYHGSDTAITNPDVSYNQGFSDLGQGFYLTDDVSVARARASSRARKTGARNGVVSIFEFDETALPWYDYQEVLSSDHPSDSPFGLTFDTDSAGLIGWMDYIRACRQGHTAVGKMGNPSVIRAWIATEEVEIACSGLCEPIDIVPLIEPTNLVVQYCFCNQTVLDALIHPLYQPSDR